jgi:serine/threonine protein kinase
MSGNHEILHHCANPNIKLISVLGSGTFGTAFLAEYNGQQVCIKRIVQFYDNQAHLNKRLDNMSIEVEYSHNMGQQKIGPEVYDAFFYITPGVNDTGSITTFIIMELFDMSVEDSYKKHKFNFDDYLDINSQMVEILYRQITYNRMYCVDIKPGNFVVKKDSYGDVTVRMIDFGKDWCNLGTYPKEYTSVDYYFLFVLIQLCIMVINAKKKSPVNIPDTVLEPFFRNEIFRKYMTRQNAETVKKILTKVLKTRYGRGSIRHYLGHLAVRGKGPLQDQLVDYVLNLKDSVRHNFPASPVKARQSPVKTSPKKTGKPAAKICGGCSRLRKSECVSSGTCTWTVGKGCKKSGASPVKKTSAKKVTRKIKKSPIKKKQV